MIARSLGAVAATSVALFIWGFLFWATPLSSVAMQPAPDDAALQRALAETLAETGTYFVPRDMEHPAFDSRHRSGPLATVHFRAAGAPPMNPLVFVFGFVHMVIVVGFAALLVRVLRRRMRDRSILVVMALIAAMNAVWSHFGDPVWFYQPWSYHLYTAAYEASGLIVATALLLRLLPRAPRKVTMTAVPRRDAAA